MSLFYFLNETERTSDVVMNTLSIQNQIQQRSDSCKFKVFSGTQPTENQDVKIYDGALVESHSDVTIVLQDSYQVDVLAFRPSQEIWLDIGGSDLEKAIIDSYVESTRTITLTEEPSANLSQGDKIGELIFGGIVARSQDLNIQVLENIEYQITGVDYTKIFDKKIISDTWEDVDSRYIINDFCNTAINFNSTIDNISYENNTAIQAEWVETDDASNPTVDTSDFLEATSSGVFTWINSGGLAKWSATPATKDLSELFGVSSGQPTKGFLMDWFKTNNQSNITGTSQQITNMDTFNGNGTWAGNFDAVNIATEAVTFKEGTGAVTFDIDVSASVSDFAEIFNGALTSVDISKTKKIRLWVYFPDAVTNITSATINWASASGANGAFKSVTTDYLGNAFVQFWNLLEFDIENPDGVFGGTIDLTAINSSAIRISYNNSQVDMNGVIVDNFIAIDDTSTKSVIQVRLGSDASNYGIFDINLTSSDDWQYTKSNGTAAMIIGTPDWTSVDYAELVVSQQGNGSIRWNGLRVNDNSSFTLFNVESTPIFDDLRSPQLKPTSLINQMAKTWENIWYIDYERDIHFVDKENDPSPFNLTNTSNNFFDLKVETDVSNIGNRIIIRGGEKDSDSDYSQVIEGDDVKREWLLKNKFKNLVLLIDDNSSTDTMEAGTTATNVTATAHGLLTGDHITNRSRSNAVRQITKVDDDNFTVETVASQTTGDTFSKYTTPKTDGVEGLTDETTVDYVSNSNEKSVRATESENTLPAGEFIRFQFTERVPIQIQYSDTASQNSLKGLGLGDGIFDLDPITDRNISDINTALSVAQAKVAEFSNAVITASFITESKGLKAGQIIRITETIGRNIDEELVIQTVKKRQEEGQFKDRLTFSVKAGTTLFGWIEFMQKLLQTKEGIELNTDATVETYVDSNEVVESDDVNQVAIDGIKKVIEAEIVESSDVNVTYETTLPWQFEPSAGQPVSTRFDLSEFN